MFMFIACCGDIFYLLHTKSGMNVKDRLRLTCCAHWYLTLRTLIPCSLIDIPFPESQMPQSRDKDSLYHINAMTLIMLHKRNTADKGISTLSKTCDLGVCFRQHTLSVQ